MRKTKASLFLITSLVLILIISPSYATVEKAIEVNEGPIQTLVNNNWFYIKNAYTGHYLDVDNGFAEPDTNVQQCQYNGAYPQKWYIAHLGKGVYMLCSDVGSYYEGNTHILDFALDVYNGWDSNGTNLQIYYANTDNYAQKFTLSRDSDSTYIIKTKASNYQKVMSLSNYSCNDGVNVHQWEYSNDSHDRWILEPINQITDLGVSYAYSNSHNRLDAFPDTAGIGGDCTNFISQALLAGGARHQDSTWFCKRKNLQYHAVANRDELNASWSLADPSPWISAKEFRNYFWKEHASVYCTGKYITDHPDEIANLNIHKGDVIQYANPGTDGPGMARHSMFIVNENLGSEIDGVKYTTYGLAYHNTDYKEKSLLDIAKDHPTLQFIFYDFTK